MPIEPSDTDGHRRPAIVPRMSQRDEDPIANTQMFRAFVERGEPEPPVDKKSRGLLLAVIIIALILAAVVVWVLVA